MLEFQPLTLQHIDLLRGYFKKQPSRICDSTIGGTFLWRDYFRTQFAEADGSLFLRSVMPETGEYIYAVPLEGDTQNALLRLKGHCETEGHPLETIPEWADYLYLAEDIKELAGKKYATQRNHISKFNRLYSDWRFTPITKDNLDAVKAFFDWFAEVNEKESDTYKEDERKAAEALAHFEEYGFLGGAVWAENRRVAMALGEVQGDTLYVHIEKADIRYHGAYQMIVREFARYACTEGVQYINREDDAGDEGLRKSKLAWRPCGLLDKYLVHMD